MLVVLKIKQHVRNTFATSLLLATLAACNLQPHPVSETHPDLIGTWRGDDVTMTIEPQGRIIYERLSGSTTRRIQAPIQSISDTKIVVGLGFLTTTFEVQSTPHHEDGRMTMTIDGVQLHRDTGQPELMM